MPSHKENTENRLTASFLITRIIRTNLMRPVFGIYLRLAKTHPFARTPDRSRRSADRLQHIIKRPCHYVVRRVLAGGYSSKMCFATLDLAPLLVA